MKIKRCSDCGRFLGEDSFNWQNRIKGYKKTICRKCQSNENYFWRLDNKEHIRKYNKKYGKQWEIDNRDKANEKAAKRKARKLDQTPELTNYELSKIDLYYHISNYLGPEWHVDHIIPISKSGLHHPDNLQIITKEDNFRKGSSLDYEVNYSFKI